MSVAGRSECSELMPRISTLERGNVERRAIEETSRLSPFQYYIDNTRILTGQQQILWKYRSQAPSRSMVEVV